jgi:hypothetical protein
MSSIHNPENRIWIELERSDEAADNHERAALASKMLARLGVDIDKPVWFSEKRNRYCFTTDCAGTFVESLDHGHWFNLDFLADPEA